MSQFSCNVCSLESYNTTLWAIHNPWFRQDSSLAGALGEQENQGSTSFIWFFPMSSDVFEGYQEHDFSPSPFDAPSGYLDQPAPEAAFQEVGPQPVPGSSTSSDGQGDDDDDVDADADADDGDDDDDDDESNPGTVVDLRGEVPHFCRVGDCRHWHTELKQIKRHRDAHFEDRYGWMCPNQTTCPSGGGNFRRKDAVNVHCRKHRGCSEALRANGGRIDRWGIPANEGDLVSYDPTFHIPYRGSDLRTRRR